MKPVFPPSIYHFNNILNSEAFELSQTELHSFPLRMINEKYALPAVTATFPSMKYMRIIVITDKIHRH